ncbi:hypothetical protein RPD_0680 [Rhodopseudomonas palustris BisB5]|uniref:Uncharacterized protein n=1 Tax=Rhodopseudomonas palustris (strain BisB5) TaxID=316057 RepID=Q13DC1_RHOPS|nr:hypothetical protein RPD_0680 [Rhodopseudomonas palustris BisB5]
MFVSNRPGFPRINFTNHSGATVCIAANHLRASQCLSGKIRTFLVELTVREPPEAARRHVAALSSPLAESSGRGSDDRRQAVCPDLTSS